MLGSGVREVHDLADYSEAPVAVEDGATFEENALIKARHYADWLRGRGLRIWCMADDSGLEVDALDGRPGVRSARYAGVDASDAQNVSHLLRELGQINQAVRSARFVCALALVDSEGKVRAQVRGSCEGTVAKVARGTGGFGYDPVFIPDGYDCTFAEQPALKKTLSHRAEALRKLLAQLEAAECNEGPVCCTPARLER